MPLPLPQSPPPPVSDDEARAAIHLVRSLSGKLGAVGLDAHDEAYHEERAPTWAAWAVVVERARREGVPCVLISPCPTLISPESTAMT